MPNVENINLVIEAIRDEANFFNMADYDEGVVTDNVPCGTPACICGWANYIRKGTLADGIEWNELASNKRAADWLGITDIDGWDELFCPSDPETEDPGYEWWAGITRAQAIETLERLRDTGKIEWRL